MSVSDQCDKMKLLLCNLLLSSLYTISSRSVSSAATFVVTQSPPNVTIMEGERVELLCCWSEATLRVKVNWNKMMMNQSILFKTNLTEQAKLFNCTTLIFSNITTKDAGRYICHIITEIPFLTQGLGTGTGITVTTSETPRDEDGVEDPRNSSIPVIVSLAVLIPLMLITIIVIIVLRALRMKQVQAARVIYEIPHVDSEEMDMDKHSSSSSRGSTQWCQVPVYESVDYFERVETEKSG
ncbi:uncharacterized protein LOC142993071 [Genypterus blacodes]|uniref:uncharacterized protein LOC142993071 n=1 Tax=Genypterus blacodes TaxID=154954 RepID=UPI003F765B63